MILFCSVFHKWSDWNGTAEGYQIRWCEGCNKQQRRVIKFRVVKWFKFGERL